MDVQVEIPNECEVCHFPVREGDYGEPFWLCTNEDCERSRTDWPIKLHLRPYENELESLRQRLSKLSSLRLSDGTELTVVLHEGRYICDGSGDIQIGQQKITFYLDNDHQINYWTEDSLRFQEIFDQLKEMLSVRKRIGDILMNPIKI